MRWLPSDNNRIQKFTADSTFALEWWLPGGVGGITVDPDGFVYAVSSTALDLDSVVVVKFNGGGGVLTRWHVRAVKSLEADPMGGYVYAVTALDSAFKFTTEGARVLGWKVPLASGTNFSDPTDIAVGPSGHVYISTEGPGDDKVHEFVDGVLVASWGGSGAEALDQPLGLAVDADENLYVADVNWMRKFSRPACS